MTTLYDKWMEFRATLNLPETHEPLVTVPRVRGERVSQWEGPSSDRRMKRINDGRKVQKKYEQE